MAAACARRPGGRWEGPARRCPPPPPTPAHSSHLARPCPDAPGTRPPQLRFPVHLRGGHSSRRPPLRPARNKGGGGDSCHRRRPPPRRGPDSPHLPLPRQPREGAAPAPRPARTHRGRADGVAAGGRRGQRPGPSPRHRLRRSSRPSAASGDRARTRGGRGGEGGAEGVRGRAKSG